MKFTLSFLFIFLLFISTPSFSQIDYFEGNPVWRIHQAHSPDFFEVIQTEYIYYLEGDSLINDTLYHKIYTHTWNQNEIIGDEFEGLIRQEDQRIYTRNLNFSDESTEFLLYDFALNVGDTLPSTILYYQNASFPTVVESIDSILIDGQFHRIIIPNDLEAVMLEGVGHHQGFFNEGMYIPFDYSFNLSCYEKNGEQVVFPTEELTNWNANGDVCDFTMSVNELNIDTLYIYPNPATSLLSISTSENIKSITILNALGEEIKTVKTESQNQTLDISEVKAGIYMVNVEFQNGKLSQNRILKL